MSFEHNPTTLPPIRESEIEEGELAKEPCVESADVTNNEGQRNPLEGNLSGDEFNKAKKLRTTKNDSEINETLKKDKTNSESSGSKESLEITRRPRVELMISNNLIFQNRAGDLSDEERSEKRRKKIKYNSSYDKKPARTTNKEESNKRDDKISFEGSKYPCKYFIGFGKCDDRYCKSAHVPIINESDMKQYIQENEEFFETLYRRRYELQVDLSIQRFLDERYGSCFPNPQQHAQIQQSHGINPLIHSTPPTHFPQFNQAPNHMQYAPSMIQPQYPQPMLMNQQGPMLNHGFVHTGGFNQMPLIKPSEGVRPGPLYIQMAPMIHSNYVPGPQIYIPPPQNGIMQFGPTGHFASTPYHQPGQNLINPAPLNHQQMDFGDPAAHDNHQLQLQNSDKRDRFRDSSPHRNHRRRYNDENRDESRRGSDRDKYSRRTPIEDRTNHSGTRERRNHDYDRDRSRSYKNKGVRNSEGRNSKDKENERLDRTNDQKNRSINSNESEKQIDHEKKIQEFDEKIKSLGILKTDSKNEGTAADEESNEFLNLFNKYKGEDADVDY